MIYTVTLNPAVDKELRIPAIELDTVLRATATRVDVGGKGFNVSRMLDGLGTTSTAVAFVGGRSGELLVEGLQALEIATELLWVDGETRTNISIVADENGRYVKVNEPGPRIDQDALSSLLNRVSRLAAPGDWWALSGSLPPGVPPSIYAEIAAIVQGAGARVILDTSGAALAAGCKARPYLVKPNAEEAVHLTGLAADDLDQLATAVSRLGPQNVVLSIGKEGALLAAETGTWRAASPAVKEANPIGAGDSLVGGLVYALDQGLSLPEALRWGVACGAATASMAGTGTGSRELVLDLLENVAVLTGPDSPN